MFIKIKANRLLASMCALVLATGTIFAQSFPVTGKVTDKNGEPLVGAYVLVQGTKTGTTTDLDGAYKVNAASNATLEFSLIGYEKASAAVAGKSVVNVVLNEDSELLEGTVVTALGIKKERKAIGYAVEDINSGELMKNKTANAISSLSGKIAGVNITQSSGAAGSGAQIILRGGTSASEGKDNQPLFVVDGIIYDNSSSVVGNSAFDGSSRSATTTSNRVMDINPEDIESMSVLKGPAASALYGSRAANGVVIINTKKGKDGVVEVNVNSKVTASSVSWLPEYQKTYARGYMEDLYDASGAYTGTSFNDFAYTSWGEKTVAKTYDNAKNFFRTGLVIDESVSVSGGSKNTTYYLSGSYYDQDGVVPGTGYQKYTFRFNGEQKIGKFTFGANVAYSQAHTDKTLTSAGLYGSSGSGALSSVYTWSEFDDMTQYLNEDGSRYRMFGDRLDAWDEKNNPYWIINKDRYKDDTDRFTGAFTAKVDITKWWNLTYRLGLDTYTQKDAKRVAADGVVKQVWLNGMMSDNTLRFKYLSHNVMSNMNKKFGDFDLSLLAGMATDDTRTDRVSMMAYQFSVPDFFSYANAETENKSFNHSASKKRLVGVFGEFNAGWKNTLFFTATARNDWTSTLPVENRSYFYPSFSGSFVFTQPLIDKGLINDDIFSFGKIRASWARVGKDTGAYETNTSLWPVRTYLSGLTGVGNSWTRGNPYIKPEITQSTELGIELSFFKNRLHVDYAYYTNDSYNQILSPRGPQSTGYIFCSINAGNVYNKGMELSISGTPIETKDLRWDASINMAGNRGTLDGLPTGTDIMYVTDVQYAGAKAASINGGDFMAITGTKWKRDDAGNVILDANGFPTYTTDQDQVGNREAKFTGGFNNTVTWKNFTFNMLWEFRVGGDVVNGTQYTMDVAGTSKFSGDVRGQALTISGVDSDGNAVSNTWVAGESYEFSGKEMSGYNIIKNYYTNYYTQETANYITSVNLLRLRSLSVAYQVPDKFLKKIGVVKAASVSLSANNLLLLTNYEGDPEAAAAGAGVGGSSSVGFDYCGVPATRGMTFGLNLTF
ncbi:MAG: SusC/RagA family TonB-linked outer membrane protein [Bacteroidales bacterium]|nr:SusC/RagA family TonB-linked outer membrane protein [Bacteroidales bacterium]